MATDTTIAFGPLRFTMDASDYGGNAYQSRDWYEEFQNAVYADIRRVLSPTWALDIGANYGLTSLFAHHRFPEARIVAVEPIPRLASYIRNNFAANGLTGYTFIEGVVSDAGAEVTGFHVNPQSSQDSRVRKPGDIWEPIETRATTLDALSAGIGDNEGVYIKIDTQGYEERVFAGGATFLARNRSWLIKSEFAPHWLLSQGTDPEALLRKLTAEFVVAEVPARTRFGLGTLKHAMQRPITPDETAAFLDYVVNLNRRKMGWVDIFVAPREVHERVMRS